MIPILVTVASIIGCFAQGINKNYEVAIVERQVLENIRTPILELIEAILQRKEQHFDKVFREQIKSLQDDLGNLTASIRQIETRLNSLTVWQTNLMETLNITEECPPTWIRHNYKCYRKVLKEVDYNTAQHSCDEMGACLVIPVSEDENEFITDLLGDNVIWIGVNDKATENSFVMETTNEVISYSNWNPNEPNDKLGKEDCVEMNSHYKHKGGWNDLRCDDNRNYICERHVEMKKH